MFSEGTFSPQPPTPNFQRPCAPKGSRPLSGPDVASARETLRLPRPFEQANLFQNSVVDGFQHGDDTPSSHRSSVWAFGEPSVSLAAEGDDGPVDRDQT